MTKQLMNFHVQFLRHALLPVCGLLLTVLMSTSSQIVPTGKTPEQVKAQAEAALGQMTPEEIDQKLKSMGVTREEAMRRAKEYGISIDDYLSRVSMTSPGQGSEAKTNLDVLPTDIKPAVRVSKQPVIPLPVFLEIPGLTDRPAAEGLEPYGYRIFSEATSIFDPGVAVSTPPSYPLGPGDEVSVNLWGEAKLSYTLVVNREGNLVVPDVGPVMANGLTISQFRQRLLNRLSTVYSGLRGGASNANTYLDVSLGKLRTIQVFVLGDLVRPGSYALSSLSTVLHALYMAGGASIRGSLRNVKIMRDGKEAVNVDVYDFLLRGELSSDARLHDGDVVFVPPAGPRVGINGRVLRPAIYEVRSKETLGKLMTYAGGLSFDSDFRRVHVQRVVPFGDRDKYENDILDIDITFTSVERARSSTFVLEDGDIVSVYRMPQIPVNLVTVRGNVNREGPMELTPGMRIKDAIMRADSLKRSTFFDRGTLYRRLPNLRQEMLWFSPRLALAGNEVHNLVLRSEDELEFYLESDFFPVRTVTISGAVNKPGTYTRYERMTAADLVVLAGGLRADASKTDWELAHVDTSEVSLFSTVERFDPDTSYWNADAARGHFLQDHDHLTIPTNPNYTDMQTVWVGGYVMFPGSYSITKQEERLADFVRRAGGPRPGAFTKGSRLYRNRNSIGLVAIDVSKAIEDPSSVDNIAMLDRDSIYIAPRENVVYVQGEVYTPSAVGYRDGASLDYYLHQAGGVTEKAKKSDVVVTLPSGKKWESRWFLFPDPDILPGSTIYAPLKEEVKDETLMILQNTLGIVASLAAITVALVQITK